MKNFNSFPQSQQDLYRQVEPDNERAILAETEMPDIDTPIQPTPLDIRIEGGPEVLRSKVDMGKVATKVLY